MTLLPEAAETEQPAQIAPGVKLRRATDGEHVAYLWVINPCDGTSAVALTRQEALALASALFRLEQEATP